MKRIFTLFFFCMFLFSAAAQNVLSGKVTDSRKEPIPGASVYVKGTYDGTSTDSEGKFSFTTSEKDTATLVVSFIGYDTFEKKLDLKNLSGGIGVLILRESADNVLNEVVITAGTFEASDEKRTTILKPLDIVTTAGAGADIFKALQTLPGAAQVGEQEGLFVRGGSGAETKAVIDGMIVQNPFFSSVPNVAQRGRFSPFQFKGTSFSTGGYSAQYGQALSSVLVLNSNDLPDKSQFNAGINFASVYGGYTHRWEKTSVDFNASYFDVGPVLFAINKQNITWNTAPRGFSQALNIRHKTSKEGILKVYANFAGSKLGITYADATTERGQTSFGLKNYNLYTNASYTDTFGKNKLYVGFSQSTNTDDLRLDTADAGRADNRIQGRVVLSRDLTEKINLLAGSELHTYSYENVFQQFKNTLQDTYWASFAESEMHVLPKLIVRVGLRHEYSRVIERWNVAPRAAVAYKTGSYSQMSLAYGQFYQNPTEKYLYINKDLDFEKADHYILNYQVIKNDRTFRIEAYRKDYHSLVREFVNAPFDANAFRFPYGATDNSGQGYAQGLDVFFRDKKSLKNAEYWISYSYLDTQRLFANYLVEAMPTFASTHNLNVLIKKYFTKLHTQINATYTYSSGRPYYNPNSTEFLKDKTPAYHNVSLSFNYLTSIKGNFTVVYCEIGNLLGTENVFGYRYSADGTQRIATNAPAFRTVFLGIHMSFDKKKK